MEAQLAQARARSTIIAALVPTPGGGCPVPFATIVLCVKICWTRWCGRKSCDCSKSPISSRMNSIGVLLPHARQIRPSVVKRRSDVISLASLRASIVCSPPIRRVFFRWMNCASACQTCAGASRRPTPNCRRCSISRLTVQPTSASPKRSRHSLRDCARQRMASTYQNASVSCGFSSRKSLSVMTRSLFATPSLYPPEVTARPHKGRTPLFPAPEVIFCVRGAITPPCGVPRVRAVRVPSSCSIGAVSHRSM